MSAHYLKLDRKGTEPYLCTERHVFFSGSCHVTSTDEEDKSPVNRFYRQSNSPNSAERQEEGELFACLPIHHLSHPSSFSYIYIRYQRNVFHLRVTQSKVKKSKTNEKHHFSPLTQIGRQPESSRAFPIARAALI